MEITKRHDLLKDNQFYPQVQKKTQICLHHTVGGNAQGSIDWWNQKPDHISTPYLIERDGTILELFDPSHWAYAFGLPNGTALEKKTIHIEICNWGGLTEHDDKYYRGTAKLVEIPHSEVTVYKEPHRGFIAFEKYTEAQVSAVIFLIDYLVKKFNIKIENVENFWHYGAKSRGLISHTTVRKDKSDIHPAPDLIRAIYDYVKCDAVVGE